MFYFLILLIWDLKVAITHCRISEEEEEEEDEDRATPSEMPSIADQGPACEADYSPTFCGAVQRSQSERKPRAPPPSLPKRSPSTRLTQRQVNINLVPSLP